MSDCEKRIKSVLYIVDERLAQSGERFLHTEEVAGPIPVALTIIANLAHPVEQLICNQ